MYSINHVAILYWLDCWTDYFERRRGATFVSDWINQKKKIIDIDLRESVRRRMGDSRSLLDGFKGFWEERLSFLENYTRFTKRDTPLPSWSSSDVDEFIASDPVNGPTVLPPLSLCIHGLFDWFCLLFTDCAFVILWLIVRGSLIYVILLK